MPILAFIVALLLVASGRAVAADGDALAVIVNRSRSDAVSITELSRIYLKKRKYWGDGAQIVPLNRDASSSVRQDFSRLVHGARAQHLATYWNEQYFHGVFPPATLSSDAAVKQYVAHDRNAIGYVAADSIDDSVRVVLVLSASDNPTGVPPPPTTPLPAEASEAQPEAP
jgi:ABC-type phosphate transport system substrate-binding protein